MDRAQAELVAHCIADQDHRIIACDDAYCELIGLDRHEIVGLHPLDLTHPLDRDLNGVLLDGLASSGSAFSITKRYVRGDRGLIWVTNGVAPVRDGLGPERIAATSKRVASPVTRSALARNIAAARRLCLAFLMGKNLFGSELVSAPGAELLLQLYSAELEGQCLNGDDLAARVHLSGAATLRWLKLLVESGLVEVERAEPVAATASFRIAKRCEMMLDALIVAAKL